MADQDRGARLVRIEDLRRCLATAFERLQLTREDAEGLSGLLVDSELRGHPDHGVAALGVLAGFYRDGTLNPRPSVRVLHETDGAILFDGDRGGGPGPPTRAMRWCIGRARKRKGMAAAAVRDWQLLVAAPYARLAAEAGLIGFVHQLRFAGCPARRTDGGVRHQSLRLRSARPAPSPSRAGRRHDRELDAGSASRPSRGTLMPEGVIFDHAGHPITDPGVFLKGGLLAPLGLPHAPHKGFGLALFIDALSGVLSGAGFAQGVADGAPGNFLWALDVEAFLPRQEFLERMDAQLDQIQQGERLAGVEELLVPASAANVAAWTSPPVASCRWRHRAGSSWRRAANHWASYCRPSSTNDAWHQGTGCHHAGARRRPGHQRAAPGPTLSPPPTPSPPARTS